MSKHDAAQTAEAMKQPAPMAGNPTDPTGPRGVKIGHTVQFLAADRGTPAPEAAIVIGRGVDGDGPYLDLYRISLNGNTITMGVREGDSAGEFRRI